MTVELEHANITVSNPAATAKWLGDVFDWKVRWHGASLGEGETYHVGSDRSYLALYHPKDATNDSAETSYATNGGLNHVAVVVDDLDAIETKVKAAGFQPHSHQNYEPGARFYFYDHDGVEYEVVSYAA